MDIIIYNHENGDCVRKYESSKMILTITSQESTRQHVTTTSTPL
jgi:hypothetical protein